MLVSMQVEERVCSALSSHNLSSKYEIRTVSSKHADSTLSMQNIKSVVCRQSSSKYAGIIVSKYAGDTLS